MKDADPLPRGMMPRLLNPDQAAAYCGVRRENFRSHCRVAPIKLFGKRVLYDRVALDKWLDGVSGVATAETETADWSRL